MSTDQDLSNVRNRVDSGRYGTLQEFLADIERASAAAIERNQSQSNCTKSDSTSLTEVVNRIAAFKKHMNSLVGQSFVNQPNVKAESPDEEEEDQVLSTVAHAGAREDKQALTILGNASNPANPKQLFSSLQKSVKVPLQSSDTDMEEKLIEVQEELREGALPNGISATKIVPYNIAATSQPPKRTFGEVFAPRSGLPQLERPRRRSNRSNSISWIDPFDAAFDSRLFYDERNCYSLTPLPSGQWLQYGGVTSSPAFWARVEKHHACGDSGSKPSDPALWTGDDTSLLQGVYSSFAPSFDSSGATIQHDVKDMIWWEKRGAKRLRTLLSAHDAEKEVMTAQPGNIGDLDESTLEEMVQSFNPEDSVYDISGDNERSKLDPLSGEVEELLAEISDLLDTLSSYQKIRHLTFPSTDGDHSDSKDTSTPNYDDTDSPSDAEKTIYETLKTSLLAIIGNLPPYAIAKLDGDQLAELNISQKILIETPDYAGTMEKDDYTLHQERAAAMSAAAPSTANRNATPSSVPRPGYQGPHSGLNQRAAISTPQVSQRPNFQVPQHGRQSSGAGSFTPGYTGGRPPNTPSQRPGYTPQQYVQGVQQFSQANNVPQFQRPTPNGYTQSPQPYTPRPAQQAGYNAASQGRTPYANAGSVQRHPYASHGTPSHASYSNSAAAAIHARSAAEQAAKAQIAAQQSRQSPSTPQPGAFEARQSQEGSLTPRSKQNGTPVQ